MSSNDELQAHTCEKILEFHGKPQDYVKKSHNERVADTSKTIDHIVDVSKKVSLTEFWKKGELEDGYYYTRYTPSVGKPFVEIELKNYLIDLAKVRDAETVEVLAPVPDYEQWKSLNEILDSSLQTNKALAHRLNLCKELLKECRDIIEWYKGDCGYKDMPTESVLTKIYKALKNK